MAKLSLRQKLEFWRKNRIWLKQIGSSILKECDIDLYKGKNDLVFASSKYENQNEIFAITSMGSSESISDVYIEKYDDNNKIGYIFGKKGIFCKNGEDALWKNIYVEPMMKQLIYNSDIHVALICTDSKCIFLKIKDGSIEKIKEIDDVSIYTINNGSIDWFECIDDFFYGGNMEIILENNDGKFSYCYITKNSFYYPSIRFDYDDIDRLFNWKIIKAYNQDNDEEIIVSLSYGCVLLEHEKLNKKIENNYIVLNNRFYLVVKENQVDNCDVIVKNGYNLKTLGEIPFANYFFIKNVLGYDYFKAKCANGCILLVMNNDSVKYKFYEGAIDINISDSILFENGNVMQLKAIAVYEKEVEV